MRNLPDNYLRRSFLVSLPTQKHKYADRTIVPILAQRNNYYYIMLDNFFLDKKNLLKMFRLCRESNPGCPAP